MSNKTNAVNSTRQSILSVLNAKDKTLPSALEYCFNNATHSEQERAYITNVTHQIYRYKLRYEALIRLYCHKADALSENAYNILLLALCEMYSMQSIPLHAAINEATQIAKTYAKNEVALINAVLRKVDKVFPNKELDKNKYMKELKFIYPKKTLLELQATYESLPSFVLDILRKQYGKEFCEKYLATLNDIPWYSYRFNSMKEGWQEKRDLLAQSTVMNRNFAFSGYAASSGQKNAKTMFEEGLLSYQGASSQIAVQKIAEFLEKNGKKDIKIWDCCAGVGGKSLALAEQGYTIALASDTSNNRIAVLQEQVKRLGLAEIKSIVSDMRDIAPENVDCILLDAPCSGIGTLCANPDLRYKITKKNMLEIIALQKELLTFALDRVNVGAYVCYITCSLNKKENEELVQECIESKDVEIVLDEYIMPEVCGADSLYLCIIKKK